MAAWGATPDMVCVCGDPLGHMAWRVCFGKRADLVCHDCQHGNHLACTKGDCPCVHVALIKTETTEKPAKRTKPKAAA